VNEEKWQTSRAPKEMFWVVEHTASERKLRLYACACCRAIWDQLIAGETRRAVEVAEAYADGLASDEERLEAWRSMRGPRRHAATNGAATAVLWALSKRRNDPARIARRCATLARGAVRGSGLYRTQAELLRDLFGNPFRPARSIPRVVRRWNGGAAVHLAQAIYDERRFGELPVLADALEDAGCTDEAILSHLRGPGPHVRGCWALDLILRKE
jgi:hypothetical protein